MLLLVRWWGQEVNQLRFEQVTADIARGYKLSRCTTILLRFTYVGQFLRARW